MAEAKDFSKGRVVLMLAAIFLSSMCTLGDLPITPIAAALFEAFEGEPEALINFAITGPALIGLPFGLIAGWLCDRFDKKWIMVIGFAFFVVGGVFGAVENIYLFVVLRCMATGVGWGITNTTAFAILADLFPDDKEHGKMVGWYNAAMSVMGTIMSFCAGLFAVGAWQGAFKIYLITIPILIMLIAFLPSMKPKANAAKAKEADDVKPGWWKAIIPLTIEVFFVCLCYFTVMYMMALFIVDGGIGDEAFVGIIGSIMTIATALTSLVFGFFFNKLKEAVYFVPCILMGLAFILMSVFPNPTICMICGGVFGLMWPFYFCYFYARVSDLVPESRVGTATGIVATSDGVAAFLCSYVLTGAMGITGLDAIGVWPMYGIILFAVVIIAGIAYMKNRGKAKTSPEKSPAAE